MKKLRAILEYIDCGTGWQKCGIIYGCDECLTTDDQAYIKDEFDHPAKLSSILFPI